VRECNCGSGLPREEVFDGHGIFLCFVCDKCRKEKISEYRKDIFDFYETDEQIEEDY
jgi:hypothetical protein